MHRVVLVDDERLARRELRSLLRSYPDVEVVGEAETLQAAAEVIRATEADIVFLDIQLGEESGFDLLPRLDPSVAVVFVTAFDRYAVRAFEAHALDYLMKPISADRLARALERLERHEVGESDPESTLRYEDFLFLRAEGRMRFIKVAEVKAITADEDYTVLQLDKSKPLRVRKRISEWEDRLPSCHFVRIHRSAIINLDYVDRVEDWFHSTFLVHLHGSEEPLQMSRRYASHLRDRRGL